MKFLSLILVYCFLALNTFAQDKTTDIQAPKAISFPEPVYGENVKQYGLKGSVSVYVRIDKTGKVAVAGASGPASLCSDLESPIVAAIRNAAIDAAARSVFEVPLKDGKPTDVNLQLTYKFEPPAEEIKKGPDGNVIPRQISGGVLNGKAKRLPKPHYPAEAHANRASGAVSVQVLISEAGEMISASAVSGHPLLREAAVEAACEAKFAPTILQGTPINVSGVLTYNFVP